MLLLTSFLSFRTGNPPIVNKTAIPPCADEPSKKVFEQAITGALCKHIIHLVTFHEISKVCKRARASNKTS